MFKAVAQSADNRQLKQWGKDFITSILKLVLAFGKYIVMQRSQDHLSISL